MPNKNMEQERKLLKQIIKEEYDAEFGWGMLMDAVTTRIVGRFFEGRRASSEDGYSMKEIKDCYENLSEGIPFIDLIDRLTTNSLREKASISKHLSAVKEKLSAHGLTVKSESSSVEVGEVAGKASVSYQVTFGPHLMAGIKVTDNKIEIEGAVDGWGNGIPGDQIEIKKI